MPVCQIEGGVKSKAVERGDAFVFPFRERAFAIAKIFSRRNFPVKSVFSKALSFLALKCPQLSFSHDSRRSACSRAKSRARRTPSHLVSRVRSPSLLPEAQRPAIQWSTRARRGARRGGGAAPSDFRRGPSLAAPREPNPPPLPGSPSGDKENKDGGMSWAGQLWKQYDPINKIIFPGVGARPTYNERGASRGPRATPSLRSPRVSRRLFPSETTDSTNTRKKSAKNSRKSRTCRPERTVHKNVFRRACHTSG